MNKKTILVITMMIAVVVIGVGIFFAINSSNEKDNNNTNNNNNANNVNDNENNNNQNDDNNNIVNDNSVVLYFSATGNTERIAEYIQEITNSDIIEIIPQEEYTSEDLDYSNDNCRANLEQNDDSTRPAIANSIDISNYDVIYLGFPIWWGDVPKIILTLMDTYDFTGKTVIPFCTSGGSGISQSMNTLRSYEGINFIDGERFSSGTSRDEVEEWINSLNLE